MTRTLANDRILRFSRRPAAAAARPLRAPKAHTTEHVTVASRPEGRVHSPVMILLVLVATLGILLYGQFLLNPANRGDLLPWLLVIGAETVLVATALLSMWTILAGSQDPRRANVSRKDPCRPRPRAA